MRVRINHRAAMRPIPRFFLRALSLAKRVQIIQDKFCKTKRLNKNRWKKNHFFTSICFNLQRNLIKHKRKFILNLLVNNLRQSR